MRSMKKFFTFFKKGQRQEEQLVGEMPPEMSRRIPWVRIPNSTDDTAIAVHNASAATVAPHSSVESDLDSGTEQFLENDEDMITLLPVQHSDQQTITYIVEEGDVEDEQIQEVVEEIYSPFQSMTQILEAGIRNENSTVELESPSRSNYSSPFLSSSTNPMAINISDEDSIKTEKSDQKHISVHEVAAGFIHGPRANDRPTDEQFNFLGTVSHAKKLGIVRQNIVLHKYEGFGLFGLYNIGNTCYMNSVLQCLANTKPFIEHLLDESYKSEINPRYKKEGEKRKGLLIECLGKLIKSVWKNSSSVGLPFLNSSSASTSLAFNTAGPSSNTSTASATAAAALALNKSHNIGDTSALKVAIENKSPIFKGDSQHDAHEFLHYFLDGIHSELNRAKISPEVTGEVAVDRSKVKMEENPAAGIEDGETAWIKYLIHDNSIIVDDFVGQLKSTITCRECGNESIKYEPFWDLSVPIPNHTKSSSSSAFNPTSIGQIFNSSSSKIPTLMQCLQLLFEENTLDSENLVYCEQCKKQQKTLKKLQIEEFPRILVIHLKRFSSSSKLTTPINFPLFNLELNGFSSVKLPVGCAYNLYGVVNHVGTNNVGHYTAYCKHPFNYFQDWFKYDDTEVSLANGTMVNGSASEAYLLFYEMCTASREILNL